MTKEYKPFYLNLTKQELIEKRDKLLNLLEKCTICPHFCKINRIEDKKGICKTGRSAIISSFGPHFGEERCLSGTRGSGTIFFSRCNLLCEFCQNYEIAHKGEGFEVNSKNLANIMIELQNMECHNINLVSPTHVIPQIVEALIIARDKGLNLPIVYNTGCYDNPDTLKIINGIIDIYMPDLKFMDNEIARKLTIAKDYVSIMKKAIKEMHNQVGDLYIDENGLAKRGLLIRHLVLPNNMANTKEAMEFLVKEISPNTYVNLMAQYRPCWNALGIKEINRTITLEEYKKAYEEACKSGIKRFDERPLYLFNLKE